MSFFKELKEDIVQSVNELSDSLEEKVTDTNTEHNDAEAFEDEVQKEIASFLGDDDLLREMTDPEQDADGAEDVIDTVEEVLEEKNIDEEEAAIEADEVTEEEVTESPEETVDKDGSKSVAMHSHTFYQEEETVSEFDEFEDNSEETTVITKGTTINGGIKSDTSLIVKGVIEGDVECQGKLTITGRVAGNSNATEIYVNTPRLEGNLSSRGSVKIDVGTVVIGSISSASVVVAGAVKGDIEVNGPIIIDSTAVVKGDITGKSIQINSGAVIDGNCSLKYAEVDLDSFFE